MKCEDVAGLVLAGGLARRMGGRHKAFLELCGRPLLGHVVERLSPQVARVAISANEQAERMQGLAEIVLPDAIPGHAGPLAGILAGLEWLRRAHPQTPWLLSVAVDTPFFPRDLCTRLRQAVEKGAEMAVACSAGRAHPVFGLWPVSAADALREAMQNEELRKIDRFTARYRLAEAAFDGQDFDPFFNINTPEDLTRARQLCTEV